MYQLATKELITISELEESVTSITVQIIKYENGGARSKELQKWYVNARIALVRKKHELNKLLRERTEIERKKQQAYDESIGKNFMDAAEATMPPAQYQSLMKIAVARMRAAQERTNE